MSQSQQKRRKQSPKGGQLVKERKYSVSRAREVLPGKSSGQRDGW